MSRNWVGSLCIETLKVGYVSCFANQRVQSLKYNLFMEIKTFFLWNLAHIYIGHSQKYMEIRQMSDSSPGDKLPLKVSLTGKWLTPEGCFIFSPVPGILFILAWFGWNCCQMPFLNSAVSLMFIIAVKRHQSWLLYTSAGTSFAQFRVLPPCIYLCKLVI